MAKDNKEYRPRTKVLHCTCTCPQQDKMYGRGRRVFNKCQDGKLGGVGYKQLWRCTSCLKEKGV